MATVWSCYTPLFFLPVLISVFTVTPDLKPVSEEVRLVSKSVCPEHTHMRLPGQGTVSTGLSLLLFPISASNFSSFLGLCVFWETLGEVCGTKGGKNTGGCAVPQ